MLQLVGVPDAGVSVREVSVFVKSSRFYGTFCTVSMWAVQFQLFSQTLSLAVLTCN